MRVTTFASAAVLGFALLACNLSSDSSSKSIVRYGDQEVAASGAAYISEGVTARSAADDSSDAVDTVPPGTEVQKVAEKDDFILVQWNDTAGTKKQGWVPKEKAAAEATPERAANLDESEEQAVKTAVRGSRLRLPRKKADPEPEEKKPGWKPKEEDTKAIAEEKPGWKSDPPKEVKPSGGWKSDPPPKEVKPSGGWKSDPPPKEVKPSGGWKSDPPPPPPPKEVKGDKPGWKTDPPKEVKDDKPASKWK